MARRKNDTWERKEDIVFEDYIKRHNSKTDVEIAEIIKQERPEGIKDLRYDGETIIEQHVSKVRKDLENK